MATKYNSMMIRMSSKLLALFMAAAMLFSSMSPAIAVDSFRLLRELSDQVFTLNPENGVTVTLSGLMPVGGYAEAENADVEEKDVLHAYDITIFYSDGSEFEPDEASPINVSFQSGDITDALGDADISLEVEHITDSGTTESVEIRDSSDGEVVFEAESFSVYIIKTHAASDENLRPRKTFHFLSPSYTQIEEDGNTYYRSGVYQFPNKLNELVATQTVTDGESLQEIILPDNNDSGLFYGWYEVNFVRKETVNNAEVYTYYWGSQEPKHVPFNEPIEVSEEEDTDVYLAPLFGHYRFLTFHQDVENSPNAATIITRKLITLGNDRKCELKISDVRAPSSNPNRIIFWGWKYTHRDTDSFVGTDGSKTEIIRTVGADDSEIDASITIEDTNVIASRQPTEEQLREMIFDIWPVFREARWIYFESGGNGANYVPPQFIMIDEPPTGFGNVPVRTGFEFTGWYYKADKGNGETEEVQVTDENANILNIVRDLNTGVRINDGQLELTAEADEQSFYAKWIPATSAKYHVIVWKQKVTDDKNAPDNEKTYDFESYTEITGSTDLAATETPAYLSAGYENYTTTNANNFKGFHFARTTVTDNGYNDVGNKVNPNGSTIVNVYYDRDLMTVTYHYQTSQLPSGTKITDSGYTYIATTSNAGEQFGVVNGEYVPLTVTSRADTTYLFPYKYTESSAESTNMYGIVNGEYVPLTRESIYVWTKSGYVYTPTTNLPTSSNNNYYVLKDNGLVTLNTSNGIYLNNHRWYRSKSGLIWPKFSDEITTAYTVKNTGSGVYEGTRYTISGYTLQETTSASGTQYGMDENGVIYAISNTFDHYEYTYNNSVYDGTRYTRTNDNTAYTGTLYKKSGSSFVEAQYDSGTIYGVRNGFYETLTKTVEETIYTWKNPSTGENYTGTRYLRFQTADDSAFTYKVVWTGLFGQPFSRYGYMFPSEYRWNEESGGSGSSQTLLSGFTNLNSTNTAANTDYHLYCQGDAYTGTLYHLRQRLDGTYSTDAEYSDIAHVSTGNVNFRFSNKFDGYDVCGYSTTFYESGHGTNYKAISPGDNASLSPSDSTIYYVYHKRLSTLELVFNNNYDGNTYTMAGLVCGQPLDAYSDAYTPPAREHYTFSGWYEDESCTKKFDFNTVMPAADKMIYAGWAAVSYRITVDPNGGEFPLGGNYSTYFTVDYDEKVTEYSSTRREYVEDPNGAYLYANFTFEKLNSFTEMPDDPAAFRKAFYIKNTEIESTYNMTFLQGVEPFCFADYMTFEHFKQCIDMNTTYSPVEESASEYRLLSWHKVRADGTEEQAPFNFSSRVTEDTNIRARWVRLGKYALTYNPTMTRTGITGDMARYNDPLESDRKFSDKSPVIILQAPTDLRLADGTPAENYVFRGWQVVDGKTREPLEKDVFYDPGDTMILNAGFAGPQGVIHMEAYYEKKENTVRRVDVTNVTLDANAGEKGVVNSSGLRDDKYEYADLVNKQLKKERQGNNFDINLKNYIKNFSHKDGHFLLGWNDSPDAGSYIPQYYADAFLGVNKNAVPPNTLYAVWEPMVYLELKNDTSYPVEFELKFEYNGTVYEGHANTMTGEYERQAFSDDKSIVEKLGTGDFKVTLPVGADIQLVLPEGDGATYTVTGGYVDDATHKTLIVYNSGDTASTTIEYNNGSSASYRYWKKNGTRQSTTPVPYSTSGTLKTGAQGQLVMFTEENPRTEIDLVSRYYDTATESWIDGSKSTGAKADAHFTLPSGSTETVSGDGYKTSVSLINNNVNVTFGLKINSYDSTNYKFIGWYTTDEAAPNEFTVDGKANEFGNASVSGLSVPVENTTYYALFVPYVKGSLTIEHNERADSAGHSSENEGLKLDILYTNGAQSQEWHASGNRSTPASCTLPDTVIDEKNTSGTLRVTVSALAHDGSLYQITYRNQTEVENVTRVEDGYSYAVFEAPVSDRFTDSETVKGLKVLRTVTYSSVFSRGYTITYKYTARDGSKKDYVLKGNADSFDDFQTFVIEHTPYVRTLSGDTVWDTQNIELVESDYGMTAVLEEKSNIRDKCTVTVIYAGGYTPSERVVYGNTFTDEQADKYIAPETNSEGLTFDYWDITNTDTGEHIANCYSRRFTFAVWNDYTITPHYSATPQKKADEGTLVTVDYIETSRNSWTNDENGTSVKDYIIADFDISYIDGERQILSHGDEYKLGVIFEICGSTDDGTFDTEECRKTESATGTVSRVGDILKNSKASGTATGGGVNYYFSKIAVNADTVSTFNRSEYARRFNTSAIKNRVFRMYAYMVTPEGNTVLSAPKYLTFFDYADAQFAVH